MSSPITVETVVHAPLELVWRAWTSPEHITHWNHASADWHCPVATNDLRPGGRFSYRMEATDGSSGFDFEGEYLEVAAPHKITFTMGDNRHVCVVFHSTGGSTTVAETFTPESTHPLEVQREGWQSILSNFRQYTESLVQP